jgi:hypothetical protein
MYLYQFSYSYFDTLRVLIIIYKFTGYFLFIILLKSRNIRHDVRYKLQEN